MKICITVQGQQLKPLFGSPNLVAGSQEFVQFVFQLDDDWAIVADSSNSVFAQFTQNGESYNVYLDGNYAVYLPAEISAGKCTLMLYGVAGDVKATSNVLNLVVDENHLVTDASSIEITQSLYDQMVKLVGDAINGTPYVANTISDMTNTDKIYIYLGSESGYVNGGWYYYKDDEWVLGGNYISSGVDVATTNETKTYLGLS